MSKWTKAFVTIALALWTMFIIALIVCTMYKFDTSMSMTASLILVIVTVVMIVMFERQTGRDEDE